MLIPFLALFCIAAEISEVVPSLDQVALLTGNATDLKADSKLANSTQLVVNAKPANSSKSIVNGKPSTTTQKEPKPCNHESKKGPTTEDAQQMPKKLPDSNLKSPAKPTETPLETDSTAPSASFCWKESYGRGVGGLPGGCPKDKEKMGLMCYDKCKPKFSAVAFVCWADCDPGYNNDGLTCRSPKPLHTYVRHSYGRGIGSYETQAGLCYHKCKKGFVVIGPVCWGKCGGKLPFDCGAGCAANVGACIGGVFEMAAATLELVANIALLVATAGAAMGAKAGATTAVKLGATAAAKGAQTAAKIAKITSKIPAADLAKVKTQIKAGIKSTQKQLTDKAASDMTDRLINSGMNGTPMDWTALDPTGIAAVIKAYSKPKCG